MNILPISNFNKVFTNSNENKSNNVTTNFGLRLKSPIEADTVSFRGVKKTVVEEVSKQTKKTAGDLKDLITTDLEKKIRKKVSPAHKKFVSDIKNYFKNDLSTEQEKKSITLYERVKTEFSIGQKAISRGWFTKNEILDNMRDISGVCFVLEDSKGFNNFVKNFSEMMKHSKANVVEVEYLRMPPTIKRGKVVKSYESLPLPGLLKLKGNIDKFLNPTKTLWKDVDSIAGYSGLHITVKHPDGNFSEVQIMTRSMFTVKDPENLFYKAKNNKVIDKKYELISEYLKPLAKKNPASMSLKEKEEEKKLHKALNKYTQEAYQHAINNPYNMHKLLSVADAKELTASEKELLKRYDLNLIVELMNYCKKNNH